MYKLLKDDKHVKHYNTDNHSFFINKDTGFTCRLPAFNNRLGELILPNKAFDNTMDMEKLINTNNIMSYMGMVEEPNPFWCSDGPELLDIMITENCNRSCAYCYQSAGNSSNHMSLVLYENILQQVQPTVAQIALGGGETTMHPDFIEVLRMTREDYGIVPNYTTNGDWLYDSDLSESSKIAKATQKYCGAVAVSAHGERSQWESKAVMLANYGIKTNIHFILGEDTIDEATDILNIGLNSKINAIVFLLYKPVGRASSEGVLKSKDKIERFFKAMENSEMKLGFDACSAPMIASMTEINMMSMDYCEGSRFSGYIHWNGEVKACSFDKAKGVNIQQKKFIDIWQEDLQKYRDQMLGCKCDCEFKEHCQGGCLFSKEIVLCNQEGKDI